MYSATLTLKFTSSNADEITHLISNIQEVPNYTDCVDKSQFPNTKVEVLLTTDDSTDPWIVTTQYGGDELKDYPKHFTTRDVKIDLVIDCGYPMDNLLVRKMTEKDRKKWYGE